MTEGALPPELRPLDEGDPEAIGPFRVVGRLGAGGMGTVFGALDHAGTCIAVKTIHSHLADRAEYLTRFTREVDLVRGVDAECAPAFLGADPNARPPWLATEFVPGRTLSGHVREFGPLTGPELTLFAAGTAEAIAALHSCGVIHQDIKPGNVILSPTGPKVLDFGIARSVHDTDAEQSIAGTPGYLAPERLDGAESTPAADVFAWAAMVVYAATGHHPYPADTSDAVLARVRLGSPDLAEVPEELLPLVRSGLERAPESRPSAADAYTTVLDTLVPDTPPAPEARDTSTRDETTRPYAAAPAPPLTPAGPAPDPRRARLQRALQTAWTRFDAAGHDPRAWGALAGAHLGAAGAVGGLVAANTGVGAGAGAAAAPAAGTILGMKTSVAVASATAVVAAGAVGGGVAVSVVTSDNATNTKADTQATAETETGTEEDTEEDDTPPFDAQEVEFNGVTLYVPTEWDVFPQESIFAPAMEAGGETEEWLVLATDGECDESTDWQAYNSADMCEHIKVLGPAAIAIGGPTTIPYSPQDVYAPVMEPQPCPPAVLGDPIPEQYVPDQTPLEEDTVEAQGTQITFRQHTNTCMVGFEQVLYPQNAWFFEDEQILLVDDWANEDLAEILEYAEV